MTRPIVKDHDITTHQIVEREMNDFEYAQWIIDKNKGELEKAQQLQKELLLEKLGITEDEAKLLLS